MSKAILKQAANHLDKYQSNNDIIDYYPDPNQIQKNDTGLYRAQVTVLETIKDKFTGQEISHHVQKILGYYTTLELCQARIKEHQDQNQIDNEISTKIVPPVVYIDPLDPVRLKRENELLTNKLFRRTQLLELLRKSYLEDVVLMKEQMGIVAKGPIDPLLKYKLPADQLPSLKGLEFSLLDRMLPRFDFRNALPLFAPTDTALLAVTPCQFCGGTVDVACFDEVAVKEIRDAYQLLKRKHTKIIDELDSAKGAVRHLQTVCSERIIQSDDATELVAKLRMNVRRLMNENSEDWLTMNGKNKKDNEKQLNYLEQETYRLEKAATLSASKETNARDAQIILSNSLDLAQKKIRELDARNIVEITKRDSVIQELNNQLSIQTERAETSETHANNLTRKLNQLIEVKKIDDAKYVLDIQTRIEIAVSKENGWNRKFKGIEKKLRKEEVRGVTDRKTAGKALLMRAVSLWGLRRNKRYFEQWLRFHRETNDSEAAFEIKKLKQKVKDVQKMLKETRRRLGTEHVLRIESVAREGAQQMQLMKYKDRIHNEKQKARSERRRSMAKISAAHSTSKMLASFVRRKSILAESILMYNNTKLTNENDSLRKEYVATSLRLECHNLISSSFETATAFISLQSDYKRKERQVVENKRIETEREIERNKLTLQRERKGMCNENNLTLIQEITMSYLIPCRWKSLMYGILSAAERKERNRQMVGWNNEKIEREEDAQVYEMKLKKKGKRIEKCLNEINNHLETIDTQNDSINVFKEELDEKKELELKLEQKIEELSNVNGNQQNMHQDLQMVVELLSNKIICERKWKNQLFQNAMFHVADILMVDEKEEEEEEGQRKIEEDDQRTEKDIITTIPGKISKKSLQRSNVKHSIKLPEWSTNVLTLDNANGTVDEDISILSCDLNRVQHICWTQRDTIFKLKHTLESNILKRKAAEKEKHKLETKLRRVTLSMPQEQRRKLDRPLKLERQQEKNRRQKAQEMKAGLSTTMKRQLVQSPIRNSRSTPSFGLQSTIGNRLRLKPWKGLS